MLELECPTIMKYCESIESRRSPLERLKDAIKHAAHLLPAQGPITVFIHHNTLHAFEQEPFFEAVERGGAVFRCEPYLSEQRFREALARGRIRFADVRSCLRVSLGRSGEERIGDLCSRFALRVAMLEHPVRSGSDAEISWFLMETEALRRATPSASAATRANLIAETRRWVMRDLRGSHAGKHRSARGSESRLGWFPSLLERFHGTEIEHWTEKSWEAFALESLWQICLAGVEQVPVQRPAEAEVNRHRDLLLRVSGTDTDLRVNDILIRFCAAYLDQGVSHWPLPNRDQGFFLSFCSLYRRSQASPDTWMKGLPAELARLQDQQISPLASALESLAELGVPEFEWETYLSQSFLALRGWAGMIHEVEMRADRVAQPIREGSLVEFVAIRLLLERFALRHDARATIGYDGPLDQLRERLRALSPPAAATSREQRAFLVFQIAQVLGWVPEQLFHLLPEDWISLVQEIESFGDIPQRRIFQQAYEKRFRDQTLDALALHERVSLKPGLAPRFQVITCLDEREESFRRHIEEVAPDAQTFGVAGFFAMAMYYRGATDAHYVPLCPIVITPKHWVEEQAEESEEQEHRRQRRFQRVIGTATHQAHVGSRSAAFGAVLASTMGVLASIPLVARILFPRLTSRVRGSLGRIMQRKSATHLKMERVPTCEPGSENGHLGFTLEEMTTNAERLLRDIGLTHTFSRLVLAIGHGSFSLNNPHKSAYDCGACGGSPGAPNARTAALVLNDPRVRERLATRGIMIPSQTHFVGGFHNTCDDSVTLFDAGKVPPTHREEFERVRRELVACCERNAHERCRRFMSAPLTLTFAEAKQHVEGRSEDLAQTRPELGHATNAICHVGRRSRTRGLFFDRRNFLTSYDPTQDDENGTILARTMAAIFPVCGGINLEYYFSHVDSPGYGCGTKLPHNIASLLGVMDGAASDLRTGLPWQMTEIHEPVRLMIICETTPEIMFKVLAGNPMGQAMTENGWVQLAVQCPETNAIRLFRDGAFEFYEPQAESLPRAATSVDWYRGWREHLEFAEIGS